ncbi:MAG TPA: hypothetical protein ENG03_01650 [Thioploca sp.]|nr:hypothetical protein [Thioploca sp.]
MFNFFSSRFSNRIISGVQGEPGTKNGNIQEYKANLVRKTAIFRSTRRTLYKKRQQILIRFRRTLYKKRQSSGVQGEPCARSPCAQEYKANLVREARVLRSTRRTLYKKRQYSGVQGEPCTKN